MIATLQQPLDVLDPADRDVHVINDRSDPGGPVERGRFARLVRGRPDDPRWARPGLLALLVLTTILYTWDLAASGYANSFYAAAVASRIEELEGDVLRIARLRELDNGRQAAGVAVGDGGLGPPVRIQQLEPARPAGARRCRGGRPAVRHGPPGQRRRRRTARRRAAGADAGGGADVPLRQPGRVAHAAAGGRRVRRDASARGGQLDVADARRHRDRLRVPDQDAAGIPRPAGIRTRRMSSPPRPRSRRRDRPRPARRTRRRRVGRLVGGDRRGLAGIVAAVHRRLDGQQRPQPGLRLQRPEPALRQQRVGRRIGRRRRWQHRRVGQQFRRRHRPESVVQQRNGQRDLLVATRRSRRSSSPSRGSPAGQRVRIELARP